MLNRSKLEFADWLRFSPSARALTTLSSHAVGRLQAARGKPVAALSWLCRAARAAEDEILPGIEADMERAVAQLLAAKPTPQELAALLEQKGETRIPKAVVLKPRGPGGERGVVFISFEYQWARLLNARDLARFAEEYTLVVSPTWSPPHNAVNLVFPAVYPAPVYCLISNEKDLAIFPRLSSNYRMTPLLASNWVLPELFEPRPRDQRDLDIVVLSNFGAYKRHFALFRALQKLPPGLKVVLVGTYHGKRDRAWLLQEAAWYGVADRVDVRQGVSDAEVIDLLGRAKVSLILSRREGSCVAVVESFFADTPVGLLEGANIGSARFIEAASGRFLPEDRLDEAIQVFLRESAALHPRAWALKKGIDCHGSTRVLNEQLRRDALAEGRPWTRDIIDHHWRPDPLPLTEPDAAMSRAEIARIREEFGVSLGAEKA